MAQGEDCRNEDPAIVTMTVRGVTVNCKTDDTFILFGDRAVVRRPVIFSLASHQEVEEAGRHVGGRWLPFGTSDITEVVGRVVD